MLMLMMMRRRMMNCTSLLLLLLAVLFISTNPVHSQRHGLSKGQNGTSNNYVYKVNLYNYVVEAGTGVNLKPPIRPMPPNLRWSSYALDKTLDGESVGSTDEYSRRVIEKCQERLKRPCTDVYSINAARKSLSMAKVTLEQADIFRVFQGTDGGFPNQFIQTRRYIPANETAAYHKYFSDTQTEGEELDRFEMKEAVNINYAVYLSVYEGHVCSFASRPKVVNRGDTLRLRCQIVLNGYWVPSLYFRNEYDGTVYEANTTACNSPVRPYRYCGLVDVQVETTVLAFACHVRFPAAGRFQPTITAYAEAQWPRHHHHHSPACYLEKLYIDTIPSDVNFLCDKMPCEETIAVGQEISCQADAAYPPPLIQLSVLIAELHPEYALTDDPLIDMGEEEEEVEETEEVKSDVPDPEEGEDGEVVGDGASTKGRDPNQYGGVVGEKVTTAGPDPNKERGEAEEEEDAEERNPPERFFLDADDAAEEANVTEDPLTSPSERPAMPESVQNASTSDVDKPEETNATATNSSELFDNSSIAENATETQTPDLQTSQTHATEVESPEKDHTEVEKPTEGQPKESTTGKPEVEKPEVEKPEVEKPEVEKPEVDGPKEETKDKRNDTAREGGREENGSTSRRPKQTEEMEEGGSGEAPEKQLKQKEVDVDGWGSEGKGEEVTLVGVYKVTQELSGKIVEVSCNISNSLGWGSNSIVLQVIPTPISTPSRKDGSKSATTPSSDEKNVTGQTHQPLGTEDGLSDPWADDTDQPEASEVPTPIGEMPVGSGEHHIDRGSQDWRKPVPTEEDISRTDRESTDEDRQVNKSDDPGIRIDQSGDLSGSGEFRQTAKDDSDHLPPVAPYDPEAQLALTRKYGPKEIKVYCNSALCIGVPRLFVGDSLRCEAQGTPHPHISFMMDTGRIINSPTFELTDEDRGHMTITCVAKNQYGSMTSRIVLTVSPKRNQLIKKFRKDDSNAARPGPRMRSFILGFNALLSIAAARHRFH